MPFICGQTMSSNVLTLLLFVFQICINGNYCQTTELNDFKTNVSQHSLKAETNLTFPLTNDNKDKRDGKDITEPLRPSDSEDIEEYQFLWILAVVLLLILLFFLFLRIRSLRKDVPIDDNEAQLNGRTVIDTTGFQEVSLHSLHSIPEAVEDSTYVYNTQSSNANNRWPTGQVYRPTQPKHHSCELPPSYEVATSVK